MEHRRDRYSAWTPAIVLLAFLGMPGIAVAAPSVAATVNRNQVSVGEQIVLTVRVSDSEMHNVVVPQVANFPEAQVSGPMGPSTSRQFQMGTGGTSQTATTEYSYLIVPKKDGVLQIPALEVKVDDTIYRTSPISVKISPSQSGGSAFSTPVDLTVQVTADTVYQGQAVVVEYRLREKADARVTNRQITNEPTFTGAWAEKLFDARNTQGGATDRAINGVRYTILPILRVVLFPTTTGELVIPEMGITASIATSTGRRDFWGEPVFRPQNVNVHSGRRVVYVKPLPAGAPAGFNGAVGSYRISSTVDQSEVAKGDPVTWTVTLEGQGNLKSVGDLILPPLSEFRAYDPDVKTEIDENTMSYGGRKVFERVLLPLHAGQVDVPPASFVYFDPERRRYQVISSERHHLTVTPGESGAAPASLGLTQSEIRRVGNDIRFIHPDVSALEDNSRSLFRSWLYWAVQGLALGGLFAAFAVRVQRDRLDRDPLKLRSRGARKEAAKRLADARDLLDQEDYVGAAGSVRTALAKVISGHADVSAASLTPADARAHLRAVGVSDELAETAEHLLAAADRFRYAPGGQEKAAAQDLYDSGSRLIEQLIQYLKV